MISILIQLYPSFPFQIQHCLLISLRKDYRSLFLGLKDEMELVSPHLLACLLLICSPTQINCFNFYPNLFAISIYDHSFKFQYTSNFHRPYKANLITTYKLYILLSNELPCSYVGNIKSLSH